MSAPKTFLFMPESAYGPTNNCIGVANELLMRGHRVVFASESSWAGKLEPLGFVEALVDLTPPAPAAAEGEDEADAGQFWKDYIREVSPEFRKSTAEQLETVSKPIMEELIAGAKYCEPRLREILAHEQPDVIIEDNVVAFPALTTAGVPYVRVVSCNPLEIGGEHIAPVLSGLGEHDVAGWRAFRAEYERTHGDMWQEFNEWVQAQGADPLPHLQFIHNGAMNLYLFPEELDYTDARPLDATWHRIDSCVRETEKQIELPPHFTDGSAPLIYFSLGSLGSADVSLMQRVIDALATLHAHIIVSKGPLHAELELADNMWGAEFLPQTVLLPLVDLVITHGGNNTVTESMHFGKPMVLLPLFWDQYDNAQRVDECGYGIRLQTYEFTADELRDAVTDLLGRTELRAHMRDLATRIQQRDGLRTAATLLEELAQ